MKLIDTHAHLYVKQFDEDYNEMVQRAKDSGVGSVILPNIDEDTSEALLQIAKENPDFYVPMMGLHPCSVKKEYKVQLEQLFNTYKEHNINIVGEIGLDYYWSTDLKEEQIDAFKLQIAFAKENNAPIAVHCRNAFDDILNILEEEQDGSLKGVLHCFSGSAEEAQRLLDINFKLGIGGVLTFKNSGLDKVVTDIGMEHLVLETDAPYLAPVPFRGKRNETAYITYVAQKLAEIKNISIEEVSRITSENAIALFGLSN